MKNDLHDEVSYDRLNAFVDRQLDRFEEARVLEAIQRDPDLERQACELRFAKDAVRNTYHHEALRRGAVRSRGSRDRRWLAVAAVALVGLGLGGGWLARDRAAAPSESMIAWLSRHPMAVRQVASTDRILLHVSSSSPERVSNLLDEAEGMLNAARAAHRPVAVEIVANGSGLDILRADVSQYAQRIEALHAHFPNLTLVACGLTMQRLRDQGVDVRLIPNTVVSTSALDQILKRIREGWTYVPT